MKPDYLELLPDRPYCTDRFGKLLIRSKERAATFPIIQHNSPMVWNWMVFDIDAPDSWFRPEERRLPPPTFIALNRENGHGHAAYLLDSPVNSWTTTGTGVTRYYDAVERGFTKRLGADRGYAGFLSKNPLSDVWEVDWQAKYAYTLDELNDYLSPKDRQKHKDTEVSATGRNCALFDMVRKEAYSRFHNFKKQGGEMPEFMDILIRFGMGVNQTFSPPLSHPEVRCICKSVAKWVFSHFDVARFSAMKRELVNRRWSKVTTLVSTKPWLELGISRPTWYRRKAALLPEAGSQRPLISD